MGALIMYDKNILDEQNKGFFHTHVSDIVHEIRLYNNRCKDVLKEKSTVASELQRQGNQFYQYKALENKYITILAEEIYIAALKDFIQMQEKGKL